MQHRWAARWLIASALLLRILVPTGYMLGFEGGSVNIELCSGYGPMKMTMPMVGMMHHDQKGDHSKAEPPCEFSGLSAPSLAGVDQILLAIAIAFILITVFRRPDTLGATAPYYLRPPLRGPPAQP
jgi:hypothetical protein